MIGIVAYSFAERGVKHEPNPCNCRLGDEVIRILRKYPDAIVVAQWEIGLRLIKKSVYPSLIVNPREDGEYLSSDDVWGAAKRYFDFNGVTTVIPVAQPFLHLGAVKKMMVGDGFIVIDEKIGPIGFDKDARNTQPWTRSRFALLRYALRVKFGGKHGHRGRQNAA